MMSKVIVTLLKEEREALIELALQELRTPSAQAHYLLRALLRELLLQQIQKDLQESITQVKVKENNA
jgi:hypothetical protein